MDMGSDDGAPRTPWGGGRCGIAEAAAVRSVKGKQKARSRWLRCGLHEFRDDDVIALICPTGQAIFLKNDMAKVRDISE
jgi:hypothetical protein